MNDSSTGPAVLPPAASPGRKWLRIVFAVLVLVLTAVAFFAIGRLTAGPAGIPDSGPDAGFARDMQAHHAQAVEMALIIRDKSADPEIRAIAYDIVTSQQHQNGQMYAWLQEWGLPQTGPEPPMAWMGAPAGGHDNVSHPAPPGSAAETRMEGMATPEQLEQLRQASGAAADRLFTELMIRHHQGGVAMARAAVELTETARVRDFAARIVDAQTAEISALEELRDRPRPAAP